MVDENSVWNDLAKIRHGEGVSEIEAETIIEHWAGNGAPGSGLAITDQWEALSLKPTEPD